MRIYHLIIRKSGIVLLAVLFLSTVMVKGQVCSTTPLTVSANTTPPSCVTGGSASINITNGNPPYTYTWYPKVSTTNIASNLPAGTYTVSITDTRYHTLPAQELVINGDFSSGNTGFTCGNSYTYCNSPGCLQQSGTYVVGSDPKFYNATFDGTDHTTGSGNYLIINGSSAANASVWCETLKVSPSTDYIFSTWVNSLDTTSPAQLQFSINGTAVGNIFPAPSVTNKWILFCTLWNSGSATSANICISNQNTALGGNDFGVDDISFLPSVPALVTFYIPPGIRPIAAATYTQSITCEGINVQFSDASQNTTSWLWDFGDGATSASASPEHLFPYNGNYYVKLVVANPPCLDSLTDTIAVGDLSSFAAFQATNIFTPNGDGVNDCFFPAFPGAETAMLQNCIEMEIYDRWGGKVYETPKNSTAVCWDGTNMHNAKAKEGTYYYIIKLGKPAHTLTYKGFVTLSRGKK